MRETPRTDARSDSIRLECEDSCCATYIKIDGREYSGDIVDADFARALERELDAKDAQINEAVVFMASHYPAHGDLLNACKTAIGDRDEFRWQLDKVTRQRDELRIQLTAERDHADRLAECLRNFVERYEPTNVSDGLLTAHEARRKANAEASERP